MTNIVIYQVDSFTSTPFRGNPAGVVAEDYHITDEQKQLIAREMACAETAFVLPPSTPEADIRIRWFTPAVEVPLCGHATVAAFHVLAEEGFHGMAGEGTTTFRLETLSGILPIRVEKSPAAVEIGFGLPIPTFADANKFRIDAARVLGIPPEELDDKLPVLREHYLYVPLKHRSTLFDLKPNFAAMKAHHIQHDLLGMCVFTRETVDPVSAVHSRFFAPAVGIDEDPVTGSANGPLGVYFHLYGLTRPIGGKVTMIGEQGDAIGRKGRVKISMETEYREVKRLEIAGNAVTVMKADMRIV
jgi:PhzF family phenazine biosynthesis protein